MPAVGDRSADRCGCWWCRRCGPTRGRTSWTTSRWPRRCCGRSPTTWTRTASSAPPSRWERPTTKGFRSRRWCTHRAGRPLALVRQRAIDELTRYIHPLTGGADGTGWLFDADLNAAAIAQLLEAVEGVDRVDEVQLFEYDLRTGQRVGAGRDVIRLDAHSLFLSGPHRVVVR